MTLNISNYSNTCPTARTSASINAITINSINILSLSSTSLRQEIMQQSLDNCFIEIDECFFKKDCLYDAMPSLVKSEYKNQINQHASKISEKYKIYLQIEECFHNKDQIEIAYFLITNMSNTGYLDIENKKIAKILGHDKKKIENVKAQIQKTFHPKNLLHKNIYEYINYVASQKFLSNNSIERKICKHIKTNKSVTTLGKFIKTLKKEYQNHEVEQALQNIQKISSSPIYMSSIQNYTIMPDIFFVVGEEDSSSFKIKFNDAMYPKVAINKHYFSLLKQLKKKKESIQNPNYNALKLHHAKAKQFINAVQSRKQTLVLVAYELCSIQGQYLANRTRNLKPLTMKAIAKKLGFHSSSITRCVADKYIESPRGLLTLRSLFSSEFTCKKGTLICTKQIDEAIKDIIKNECKYKPIPDIKIKSILENINLPCSRRNVTKRRKILNIPNSRNRGI